MPEHANVGQHYGTHLRERTCERKCQNYYLTRQTVIVRNSAVGVIYDKKLRQMFEHKTDHVNGEFMRKNDNELRGL